MPTIKVGSDSHLELQQIADALGKSKKVVVVTGAGISTNCGIPDFRSENGLYSLIQAQYNAALLNPPWEETNTFDIDDRPKKKRRTWYYEVVAPDGKVVDVIDEEIPAAKEESLPASRTRSFTTTRSRSGTPKLEATSNAQGVATRAEATHHSTRSRSRSLVAQDSCSGVSKATTGPITEPEDDALAAATSTDSNHKQSQRSPFSPQRQSSKSRSISPSLAQYSTGPECATVDLLDNNNIDFAEPESQPSSGSRSSNTNTISSRSSTPKSTASSLTSLSSNTPELSDDSLLDCTQLSAASDLSGTSEEASSDDSSLSASQSRTGAASLLRTTLDTSTTRALPNLKGRDLFDSMIWADPFTTSIFYMFISSLRDKIEEVSTTTETHKFLRVLRDGGRLVRNYTQNIDMLEEREGLCQELEKGPGSKGRFSSRFKRGSRTSEFAGDVDQRGGCESVALHGSLRMLRCNLCGKLSSWDDPEIRATTLAGSAPDCQACTKNHSLRTSKGRRGVAIGRLRPDIVLYGEEHPNSNLISPIVTHDLNLGPDVLLIMGTSLRVHGLKIIVREFAKAVHTRGGKVVFVNQTKPPESTWGEFIDYWVECDCDEWVVDLRDRRSDLWTGEIEQKCKETMPDSTKRWRPQALRDDKINGVHYTFKILDTLRAAQDANGQTAARFSYWQSRTVARISDVSLNEAQKKPPTKKGQAKKGRKSEAATKAPTKPKPKKRKSQPELPKVEEKDRTIPYRVSEYWEELQRLAPGLGGPPLELRRPFGNFASNKHQAPDWFKPFSFAFKGASNHMPNVGGSPWLKIPEKMDLISQPPNGTTIPIHSPKSKPEVEQRKITHGYGTRASRRFSTADTIVVGNGDAMNAEKENIIEKGGPMTPSSRRIKRRCSIGALVSSSPEQWHDAPEVMT